MKRLILIVCILQSALCFGAVDSTRWQLPAPHYSVTARKPGESVWSIIQREGITDEAFREMNGLPVDVRVFKTRQQVLLRKQK